MNHELEDYADIEGERCWVRVMFEVDGYKPFGLWVSTENGVDVTFRISQAEYDRLYSVACKHVADELQAAAEQSLEYFNRYVAGDR